MAELNRKCRCKNTGCDCTPCTNDMTQEDLLCGHCRELKGESKAHCHRFPLSLPSTVRIQLFAHGNFIGSNGSNGSSEAIPIIITGV